MSDLPDWACSIPPEQPLETMLVIYCIHVLKSLGGNRTMAAKSLSIAERTLRCHIVKAMDMGLDVPPALTRKKPERKKRSDSGLRKKPLAAPGLSLMGPMSYGYCSRNGFCKYEESCKPSEGCRSDQEIRGRGRKTRNG